MTTRRWMLAVIGMALILGLIVPAVRVGFDSAHELHYHVNEGRHGDGSRMMWSHPNPFWPRYRAMLMGQSWDGDVSCRERGVGLKTRAYLEPVGYKEIATGDDLAAIQRRLQRSTPP